MIIDAHLGIKSFYVDSETTHISWDFDISLVWCAVYKCLLLIYELIICMHA